MKEPDSSSNPDEQGLDEVWACLKTIEPPLETRIANRVSVASELVRTSDDRTARSVPFWWRPVAIPWPVAAATIAALVALSTSKLRSGVDSIDGTHQDASNIAAVSGQPMEDRFVTTSATPRPCYQQTMTYLCGIGSLRSESRHYLEE